MKDYYGYYTKYGFRGRVNGRWMEFASEEEYYEYLEEHYHEN